MAAAGRCDGQAKLLVTFAICMPEHGSVIGKSSIEIRVEGPQWGGLGPGVRALGSETQIERLMNCVFITGPERGRKSKK